MAFIPPPPGDRRIASRPRSERLVLLAALVVVLAALIVTLARGAKGPDLEILPSAETFAGLNAGITFPRSLAVHLNGKAWELRALGSGTRRQLMFSVYEGAAYAEAGRPAGDEPARELVEGGFVAHLRLRFLRGVTGDKLREGFASGLVRTLPVRPSPDLAKARDAFLDRFGDGVGEGETVEITRVPEGGLFVRVAGKTGPPVAHEDLARAVWAMFFGERPMSEDLRRDMLRLAGEN